jgi:hypothetical protein
VSRVVEVEATVTPLFVIDTDPDNPVSDEDIEAILQPDSFEVVVRVTNPRDACMEALGARSRVFPSKGQARKNGFAGPVPHGLEVFGAGGSSFFVWNPTHPESKPIIGKRRILTKQWFKFLETMRASGVRGSWSQPDMQAMSVEWKQRREDGSWSEPFLLE